MTTLTRDIRLLCQAIDAGDDTTLAPLADALEEIGCRAGVIRAKTPRRNSYGWCWWRASPPADLYDISLSPGTLTRYRFARLSGGGNRKSFKVYPTRSAALLALAEALAKE